MTNSWHRFPHLLRILWTLGPSDIAKISALHLISGLMPICAVISLRNMVDHAVALIQGTGDLQITLLWLGAVVVSSYLMWASMPIRDWIGYSILARFNARAQERLLTKASRVPLSTFETPKFYDQLQRAHLGLNQSLFRTMESFFPIPAHLVTCIGLLTYLGTISWWLPLVLLIGIIPGHVLERKFDKKRYQLIQEHTPPQRRMEYLGELLIRREAAAEIRLFGLENHLLDRWHRLFRHLRNERVRLAYERARAIITGVMSDQLAYSMVLTGLVALIARGTVSVGAYVATMDAISHFRDSALMFLNGIRNMEDSLHYLGDLLDYLELAEESRKDTEPPITSPDTTEEHRSPYIHTPFKTDGVPEVRFENVTFTYEGSVTPVLEGLDLTIHPGERIALVGENGAGKTTLAKLLLGLYWPTDGQILVDGQPLDDTNRLAWRKHVGAVFQDYMRYQITARENIGFGNLDHFHHDEKIQIAAQKSSAHELVTTLSSGYETVLGRIYDETGQDLSVGQWQKLAIARAYLREAQVLVLDEPTAALDARAEVDVYRQFQNMSQGKSVLLISHRLGSARLADRIVFLNNGKIAEEGSHQTLMQNNGQYARMFAIQAEWYQ